MKPSSGLVLLYHRIADLQPDSFGLCIHPEAFRAQMEHIARAYRPAPLDDLAAAAAAGDTLERGVAVTFDDGNLDALTASGILSELGIAATFYLNTDRIDTPHENWYDVLERIFLSESPLPARLPGTIVPVGGDLSCDSAEARRVAFDALYHAGVRLSADDRRDLMVAVAAWSRLDLEPRRTHRVLTTAEVVDLSGKPGHSIGAHTTHHLFLPAHPAAVQEEEIETNRRALAEIIGRPVTSFAYPFGATTPAAIDACRRQGFRTAVTVESRALVPFDDPMLIPRIEVKHPNLAAFTRILEEAFSVAT